VTDGLLPFAAHVERQGSQILPRLELYLRGRGWVTRRVIAADLQTDDRTIREAASQSEGRIISGQKGYCRLVEATIPEVQHAADWLRSQAKQMLERAYAIEQAMHRRNDPAA
jgi:hypothetical protein